MATPGDPRLKRVKRPHKDTVIKNQITKGESHKKHRKVDIVPEAEIGPDCRYLNI